MAKGLTSFFEQSALRENFDSLVKSRFDIFLERPRIATGSDGVSLEIFERQLDQHLRAIERKVLQGRYTFAPLVEIEIPKSNSAGVRTISIATIRDTIVQRALYRYLNGLIDPILAEPIFGYRPRRNTTHAVRLIQKHYTAQLRYVFETDLSSFFDNIEHDYLLEKFDDLPDIDPIASKLIFRFIKTHRIPFNADSNNKTKPANSKLALPRLVGLPQGGVLSGILSNLYLNEFDHSILRNHKGYVRYADDFIVCCDDPEQCEKVQIESANLLPPGAHLNLEKTITCTPADNGIEFIGFRISVDKLGVRSRNIARFKARINHVIETQWVKNKWHETLDVLTNRLAYKIRGPMDQELQTLADLGCSVAPFRRSWIGFFRCVDDYQQIRNLDRWIRARVTKFMWEAHGKRVNLTTLQRFELPSLVNVLFKARRSRSIPPSTAEFGET